jgi:tetratricopeptide (TPR) repeat protein
LLSNSEHLGTLSAEHGFPYWEAYSAWERGCCLSISGRSDQAIPLITEAVNAYQAIGAVTAVPMFLTSLAEALGKAGRLSEGLEKLNDAARQIEANQEGWTEADMHRVRGELLIGIGDLEAAEQSFHQAIAVARRQTAHFLQLTPVQDQAIAARMPLIVGGATFDRLFASVRFDEVDGDILYVYAKDEGTAAEMEDAFALHISIVATDILKREVGIVLFYPNRWADNRCNGRCPTMRSRWSRAVQTKKIKRQDK